MMETTMTSKRSNLSCCLLMLAAVLALAGVAGPPAVCAHDEPDPEPPGSFPKTTRADRDRSANNLKQMVLAMINFADATGGGLPANAIVDKTGKPLLSWRVAILPYIEENPLYREFKLDEPWDSKHNKKLLERMPKIYAPTITGKPAKANSTYYQVFTGPDTAFNPKAIRGAGAMTFGARYPAQFTDGTSNTILVVEAEKPVPWTKPEDVPYDPKKLIPKLGGLFPEGFHIALADGSTRIIARKFDEKQLRAAITPSGGEVLDWSKLPAPKRDERK
jgi:hypothetical protein